MERRFPPSSSSTPGKISAKKRKPRKNSRVLRTPIGGGVGKERGQVPARKPREAIQPLQRRGVPRIPARRVAQDIHQVEAEPEAGPIQSTSQPSLKRSRSESSEEPPAVSSLKRLRLERLVINGKMVAPELAHDAIAAVRRFLAEGSLSAVPKTSRNHAIFKLMQKKAYKGREEGILEILETWLDEGKDSVYDFKNWEEVLNQASREFSAREAHRALSPEEQQKRRSEFAKIGEIIPASAAKRIPDPAVGSKDERKFAGMLSPLTRQASDTTDMLGNDDKKLFLALKRRKMHKAGQADLPGKEIRYRTSPGSISPKPNAFVLGGADMSTEYGPLLEDLTQRINATFAQSAMPAPDDSQIAHLFLDELAGKDAFGVFPPEVQLRAHKIISIILFAELSRHSIALVSAAAAFHAVAAGTVKLVDAFETGSGMERPLFAGEGGAEVMRNQSDSVKGMSSKELITRRARGVVDILNFLNSQKAEGETLEHALQRKTLEFIRALAQHTDEPTHKLLELDASLYQHLQHVYSVKKQSTALDTLRELGFRHSPSPGDANNCAIFSLYDQLTQRHGLVVGNQAAFVKYVRLRVGGPLGAMIDLVGQGQAMLTAANRYLTEIRGLRAVALTINVWASTGDDGELMEFNNVARAGAGNVLACTFYYNGINHFDSLLGGPDLR